MSDLRFHWTCPGMVPARQARLVVIFWNESMPVRTVSIPP